MNEKQARIRGILAWEAACERLKFALQPPEGQPPASPLQVVEALRIVRKAVDELEKVYWPKAVG